MSKVTSFTNKKEKGFITCRFVVCIHKVQQIIKTTYVDRATFLNTSFYIEPSKTLVPYVRA